MKKKYRITCKTDPYHASRCARYKGREILERDGATPVKWVHDDYFGQGKACRAPCLSAIKI